MTPNESTAAALSAVLTEAGAKVCGSCGTQAAVRVPVGARAAGESAQQANPALLESDVWFCFECGHEERAVD